MRNWTRRPVLAILPLLAGAVLLLAFHSPAPGAPQRGPEDAEPVRPVAPAFRLMDAGGRYRELAEFRGRPVVLNFWATWCRPCRDELPLLDRVYRRYRERGLEVVAISIDEKGWRAIRPFLSSHPVSFPVLLADSRTRRSYGGPPVVPTTWFLDRRGRVVATHREALEAEQLRGVVELLLGED